MLQVINVFGASESFVEHSFCGNRKAFDDSMKFNFVIKTYDTDVYCKYIFKLGCYHLKGIDQLEYLNELNLVVILHTFISIRDGWLIHS